MDDKDDFSKSSIGDGPGRTNKGRIKDDPGGTGPGRLFLHTVTSNNFPRKYAKMRENARKYAKMRENARKSSCGVNTYCGVNAYSEVY